MCLPVDRTIVPVADSHGGRDQDNQAHQAPILLSPSHASSLSRTGSKASRSGSRRANFTTRKRLFADEACLFVIVALLIDGSTIILAQGAQDLGHAKVDLVRLGLERFSFFQRCQ